MNKKNIFYIIVLLAIFSATSILSLLTVRKTASVHANSKDSPDFFMTNAVYVKFDQDGNTSNNFYTSKISHFSTNNNYFFDNPRMKIYNASEQPWDITAKKGRSEQGKSKIYLWDNVRVIQAKTPTNPDFDITTTTLIVYFDTKSAKTDKPLTIIQSGSIAKAIGAEADFKLGVVKLLSNVECQYKNKKVQTDNN